MATKEAQQVQKVVTGLLKTVAGRNRDIISRRFGLQNGKKETLESIGRSYGITRERVRQIEEFTLTQIGKAVQGSKDVERYASLARNILTKEDGIMKERSLFESFSGNEKDSVANASLVFLLTVSGGFVRFNENDHFHSFWTASPKHMDSFRSGVVGLISALNARKAVIPAPELYAFAQQRSIPGIDGNLTEKHLATFMAVSKDINRNIFNEIGLASWSEIRPKGVRDKAYLMMKKEGKPKHFTEIAKLINVAKFDDKKKVNVQTVHNELIKDARFVLVGRGMYALSEWGYKSGTVRDVLTDILRNEARPMHRTELVAKVMDSRMVKENTILLNLQDSSHFKRQEDGTYVLKKA